VQTARAGHPGRVLVDGRRRTLHIFARDLQHQGRGPTCHGACAALWPPLKTDGTPVVAGSAKRAKVDTIRRAGGDRQVTYGGFPVYLYQGSATPDGERHRQQAACPERRPARE
jgi:predicted lipoprotein with Yx(FWY)xxD motif